MVQEKQPQQGSNDAVSVASSSSSSLLFSSSTIFYSTQTRRAKACARRTARILCEECSSSSSPFSEEKTNSSNTTISSTTTTTSTTNRMNNGNNSNLSILNISTFDDAKPNFIEYVQQNIMHQKSEREEEEDGDDDDNNNRNDTFLLFFVSTTGDGEHCGTIQSTWKQLLKKSLPKNSFRGVPFALFCLGDRKYGDQFCAAGRKLAIRLLQLGMVSICEIGYGDDQTPNGGVFNDLDMWIHQQLLYKLKNNNNSSSSSSSSYTNSSLPKLVPSTIISSSSEKNNKDQQQQQQQQQQKHQEKQENQQPEKEPFFYKVTILDDNNSNKNTNTFATTNIDECNDTDAGADTDSIKKQKTLSPLSAISSSLKLEIEEEEWEQRDYKKSYQLFFRQLNPTNAYNYDGYARRRPNRDDEAIKENKQMSQQQQQQQQQQHQIPLIGEIIANEYITDCDWKEQETRHIEFRIRNNYHSTDNGNSININDTSSTTTTTTRNTTVDTVRHSYNETKTQQEKKGDNSNNSSNNNNTTKTGKGPKQINEQFDNNNIEDLPYLAGDVAVILPRNGKKVVERFLSVLPEKLRRIADTKLCIESNHLVKDLSSYTFFNICTFWPKYCTLRGLLTYCMDIQSLPEREDLRALSDYCSVSSNKKNKHQQSDNNNNQQSLKLKSLSETSQSALYVDYILREKRNWVDVFYDFDTLRSNEHSKLCIEALLELFSPLRPREFSIASSPTHKNLIMMQTQKRNQQQQQQQQQQQNGEQPSSRSSSDTTTTATTITTTNAADASDNNIFFEIDLCVGIVQGETPFGRKYHGLCSHYLSKLSPSSQNTNTSTTTTNNDDGNNSCSSGTKLHLWIRPGTFHGLPLSFSNKNNNKTKMQNNNDPTTSLDSFFDKPILCIGAGTGIAPLRSLILEREAVKTKFYLSTTTATQESMNSYHNSILIDQKFGKKEKEDSNKSNDIKYGSNSGSSDSSNRDFNIYDNILIFGCRYKNVDYYYQREWEQLSSSLSSPSSSTMVLPAFSRQQVTKKGAKMYVQYMIEDDFGGEFLRRHILENKGCIYIAGNPDMASSVKETIIKLLSESALQKDEKYCQLLLKKMQKLGRLSIEAW